MRARVVKRRSLSAWRGLTVGSDSRIVACVSTELAHGAYTDRLTPYVASELRAHLGRYSVSRSELARRLDVDNTWVGKRLSCQTAITLEDLDRMAAALQVPVETFLPPSKPASSTSRRASNLTDPAQPQRKPVDALAQRIVAVGGEARPGRSRPKLSPPRRPARTSSRPVTPLPV